MSRRFQSSPVTKDGRYPAARPPAPADEFQSSPVTKDGRYFGFGIPCSVQSVFQSSPVTKDGRY